ncbi:MAG TPA: TrbC/VirB2 family protein [Allosphingosinicella sp.]|jgi:type IV secretion system protein VirB2
MLSYAPLTPSLADPAGTGAVAAAVGWLQGTLLGTAATSVAVICVAAVGLMMMSGRLSFRRAGVVVLGCFIVFGASAIAGGIHSAAGLAGSAPVQPAYAPPQSPPPPPPAAAPADPDPSAGAAVPSR